LAGLHLKIAELVRNPKIAARPIMFFGAPSVGV